ncbi:MAG: DMT family transporter, partial [Candidatus Limnocylindrales bacterium]
LFFALGFFWGSSYLFIKIGVETVTPFTLIAGRLLVGSLLLVVALRLSRATLPRDPRMYGHLFVMALINIVIPFSLITWGETTLDSGLAAILTSTVPLFTIILAALFLVDEPMRVNRVVGLAIGFIGVVAITAPSLDPSARGDLPGELALILAAVSYAAGNVYARRNVRGLKPIIPPFFQVFFAFLVTGILAVVFENPLAIDYQPSSVVSILWLGLLGSGLAYLVFFRLLAAWGSTRSSLVAYLLPVVGIVLGAAVLGETVAPEVVVGTALVVGGIAVTNNRRGQRRLFGGEDRKLATAAAPAPTASTTPAATTPAATTPATTTPTEAVAD